MRPHGVDDAILFFEFDGESGELTESLKNILNNVEANGQVGFPNEEMLLEILPITHLVEERMYSLLVAHNISGIREKSISLLEYCDNLQGLGVAGILHDCDNKERNIGTLET